MPPAAFMTLAIFLNLRFYYDGTGYTADESYFMFWMTFTEHFSRVIFCVPVLETKEARGKFPVDLLNGRIEVCHLPFYRRSVFLYAAFPLYAVKMKRIFRENISDWNLVGAVIPNALGQLFLRLAEKEGRPSFGYIRGNVRKTVKSEYEKKGALKLPANAFAWWLERQAKNLFGTRPTFVVGRELFDLYGRRGNRSIYEIYPVCTGYGPDTALRHEEGSKRHIYSKPDALPERGPRAVTFIGRLSREKGVSYLIDAVQLLLEEGDDIRLNIVGSGDEEAFLRQKAARQGLEGKVRFLGYIPYGDERIFHLYRDSLACVLPSVTEGFPKVILEAMANRTPVIATAVGGVPAVITDGLNGILVPPADSGALARAIIRLHGSPGLRARLVENGLETAGKLSGGRQRDYIAGILKSRYGF
ncbi:MAG: glycosyltransferase [Nitrospiraceae bacterium]|nr:glycosyltransferase [Nitrospiraceae bacterium]